MSQDFFDQFGLGSDALSISTVDIAGVTIAAVQAQQEQLEALKSENQVLKKQNEELQEMFNRLSKRINILEIELINKSK